jgi:hypothetical protein
MLNGFNEIITQIVSLFQWWIVIAPWESAIRVRRGKKISVLAPGIHFRIPALDRFFVQNTRKRYMNTPTQTATSKDGKAVTVSGGTAYSIVNIAKLYDSLSDPEDVIQIETLSLVAQYIADNDFSEVRPENIQRFVDSRLNLEQYGLGGVTFLITDFVCVKTFRLIQSNPKDWSSNGAVLSVKQERLPGKPGLM